MMTAMGAILAGAISSSITSPVIESMSENLYGCYMSTPTREDSSPDPQINILGPCWADFNEKPSGFTGASVRLGGNPAGMMSITAADSSHMMGTSDFTIEFWAKSKSVPTVVQTIVGNFYPSSLYRRWEFDINYTNRRIEAVVRDTAGTLHTMTYTIGTTDWNSFWAGWHHYAIQRNDAVITLYIDGVAGTSVTIGSGVSVNTNSTMGLVFGGGAYSYNRIFTGWMDEFRITKGAIRYTSFPFTPPGQFPRGGDDPMWSNVSLLMGFDNNFGIQIGGTAGFTKEDVDYTSKSASNNPYSVTDLGFVNRVAQKSTFPTSSDMNLEEEDFTFELDFYRFRTANYQVFNRSDTSDPFPFQLISGGNLMNVLNVNDISGTPLFTYNLNQIAGEHYRVAVVRDKSVIRLYINGALVTTGSISGPIATFDTKNLVLSTETQADPHRIRAFRISKGARYKGPTYVLPDMTTYINS